MGLVLDTSKIEVSPQEELQLAKWEAIKKHIGQWFIEFDYTALQLGLALYCNHFVLNDPPTWAFIIGVPSSGKTRVVMNSLASLQSTYSRDSISANSFLSGYGSGRKGKGLLKELVDGNGILLFSDFSTFLALQSDTKIVLQAQMRRMYDGALSKETGNIGEIEWKGKLTIIAACTPELENYWTTIDALGERFVYYKMPTIVDKAKKSSINKRALTQLSHNKMIDETLEQLIKDMVGTTLMDTDVAAGYLAEEIVEHQNKLVILVGDLRRQVNRDWKSPKQDITSIAEGEALPRLMQQLTSIIRGSMMLFKRNYVHQMDYDLAVHIAFDTIPKNRFKVVSALFGAANHALELKQLRQVTKLPDTTLRRTVEDLEAIEVVLQKRNAATGVTVLLADEYIGQCNDVDFPKANLVHLVVSTSTVNKVKNKKVVAEELEDV